MNTPVGIDVSSKSLDVAILVGDRAPRHYLVHNDAADHRQLIRQMSKLESPQVVLEATGTYHLDLAFALRQARVPLMVLNPKRAKDFVRSRGIHVQTDKVDAIQLAEFGKRMDFVPWKGPSQLEFQIFKLGRAIASMTKDHTRLLCRLHAESACSYTPAVLIKHLKRQIKLLDKLLVEQRDQQRSLVLSDPTWNQIGRAHV